MPQLPTEGYRRPQIALHWGVFALAAFQFFAGDNMTHLFRASLGGKATPVSPLWTPVHIVVGVAIVLAMLWRLNLRRRYGAPPPPASQAAPLNWLAAAVHVGLYADLIGAGIVGVLTYFWFPGLAGLHEFLSRFALLVLLGLHVVGALWHHFALRDDVMRRMVRPIGPE